MTTWQEAWDTLNDPNAGNFTCDGAGGCDYGLLGVFGIIIPLVLVVGLVGLLISAVKFKEGKEPPQ